MAHLEPYLPYSGHIKFKFYIFPYPADIIEVPTQCLQKLVSGFYPWSSYLK